MDHAINMKKNEQARIPPEQQKTLVVIATGHLLPKGRVLAPPPDQNLRVTDNTRPPQSCLLSRRGARTPRPSPSGGQGGAYRPGHNCSFSRRRSKSNGTGVRPA